HFCPSWNPQECIRQSRRPPDWRQVFDVLPSLRNAGFCVIPRTLNWSDFVEQTLCLALDAGESFRRATTIAFIPLTTSQKIRRSWPKRTPAITDGRSVPFPLT